MTKLVKVSLRNKKGNLLFGYKTDKGEYYFMIATSYLPSNSGRAFAPNFNSSIVSVSMHIDDSSKSMLPRENPWDTPWRTVVFNQEIGEARSADEADKMVRKYIREHNLRSKLKELIHERLQIKE